MFNLNRFREQHQRNVLKFFSARQRRPNFESTNRVVQDFHSEMMGLPHSATYDVQFVQPGDANFGKMIFMVGFDGLGTSGAPLGD